jgi:predicted O-linked N-acetylglucosamine transferase (SPINDLY family)
MPSSEKPLVLPESYWCYSPPDAAPEVNALPAESSGVITFGCLNKNYKVSDESLTTWARILASVAGSRLLLHAHEGVYRQRVLRVLHDADIDASRIDFVGPQPLVEHLRTHHRFDIALDPFPYNGGTVTCDALYMGVPVVSLAGELPVHRAGLSILTSAGAQQWAAGSIEEYIRIATELAGDLPRLAEFRAELRQRVAASNLMNAPRFVMHLEQVYRRIWRDWCLDGHRAAAR